MRRSGMIPVGEATAVLLVVVVVVGAGGGV
jgi:hypothetical protein